VRLIERLREAQGLALHDLVPIQRLPGTPECVDLAAARTEGDRPAAVAATSRDQGDLAGWGLVAAAVADDRERREICLVAPAFTSETRRSAARLAERGIPVRLIAVPALASGEDEVYAEERHPAAEPGSRAVGPATALIDQLIRVIDGAAALSGVGELRTVPGGLVLYVRGRLALRIRQDGDGVTVALLGPDKREVHVNEAGFGRWAVELHEVVVELARDPRLLDEAGAQREQLAEGAALQAGVRVTARWLPCSEAASDPVDWVGQDPELRPVLGLVRRSIGLADVPGLVAALHRFEQERELWAPGSAGPPRLLLVTDSLDDRARSLLQSIEVAVSVAALGDEADSGRPPEELEPAPEARREPEPSEPEPRDPEPSEPEAAEEEPSEREGLRGSSPRLAPVPLSAFPGEDEPTPAPEPDEELSEPDLALEGPPLEEFAAGEEPPAESFAEPPVDPDEARLAPEPSATEGDEDEPPDRVEAEIEATLAEEPESEVEEGPIDKPPARRRSARAAIVVCDDPDCVLAALVLARERRSIVSFVVCPQEGLMDYFRTRATDLGDNVDLLLVGFNAQPVPHEVISTAELYRSRLEWFDHHDWPIEDLEMLREAIGRDAIQIVEGAAGPLAAVMEISERRSRFTDKLIDVSGRRLGQGDMEKWGLRLMGLVRRIAAAPGDWRAEIVPVLAGKPAELPEVEDVYAEEQAWLETHDPRLVYFGEYQMVVVQVPENLDAGEVARRLRLKTGARLSMATRAADDLIQITCTEEKRHVNVVGVAEQLGARIPWAEWKPAGDRTGRLQIQDLARHPERAEIVLSEIVRHKSILYG
jgi:hypothetical protein